MTRPKPDVARALRMIVMAALAVSFPLMGALAAGSPIPSLKPSPRPRAEPPMRILRVVSSDKACAPDCPEWISAEGIIRPGSAAAFAHVVEGLNGRRLPVLISSHGGSVRDALEMGALIRAKGLAVAVARTLLEDCPERARACPDPRGAAVVGGASCGSACPLVLAGGVERLVGPAPLVGVHEITTIMKETEGVAGLHKTVKLYEQDWVDRTVETYLSEAGVGEPVMSLLRKTPAANIRWLSLDELRSSGLATAALDPVEPILAEGASGLNARAFGADAEPDLLTAKVGDKEGLGLVLTLAYRRGGGALEVGLTRAGAQSTPVPADWASSVGGGASDMMTSMGSATASALLPRDRFCKLGRTGLLTAVPQSAPAKPVSFDLADAAGVETLVSEACP